MSAIEVIEEIKKLSQEERQKVIAFVHQVEASPDTTARDESFEKSLRWAVDEHRDLLRRLAQ